MKRTRGIVKGIGGDGMIRFSPYHLYRWEDEEDTTPLLKMKNAQVHDEVTITSGTHTVKVYGLCIESLRDALDRVCTKRVIERVEADK